jgi:aromatic ring-cleaving dioxygenase
MSLARARALSPRSSDRRPRRAPSTKRRIAIAAFDEALFAHVVEHDRVAERAAAAIALHAARGDFDRFRRRDRIWIARRRSVGSRIVVKFRHFWSRPGLKRMKRARN